MIYQQESVSALWNEIEPLLSDHFHEIAHFKDIPLNVNKQAYEEAERQNGFIVITARDNETLVGYIAFFLNSALHYRQSVQAVQDVIYLKPEYRGEKFGTALIRFAEDLLRQMGVEVVYQRSKLSHDYGKLLQHLGYAPIETTYGRRL